MEGFREYDVSFSGLKLGDHTFEFPLDQKFFDLFSVSPDFDNLQGNAQFVLTKKNTFMEAHLKVNGTVELVCDHSAEDFTQNIQNTLDWVIKFGEEYDDSDDEIWIIPHNEHQINIAQMIYEAILLAIPMKRVKPEYAKEDELYTQDNTDKPDTDPRWDALKKLKK